MNKMNLTEADIRTKFITPAIEAAGWDKVTQMREEYFFTAGRIIVRGKLVARGKGKKADYLLYASGKNPIAVVEAKDNKVQTKEILAEGDYPVVDQGKVFIRGYCNDSKRVIQVADPIIVFGDHTRETKLVDFDFVVGADGAKLLQPICINPHYYFLVLRWLPLESRGYARHFKLLKAARIPLPRLARASLARFAEAPTPANLNLLFHKSYSITPADLRKAILTLAIQGRLLLQDSTDESAEKLFQRIQAEQKQLHVKGICKIPKPLPPVAESEVPFLVPVSWKWFRLRTLVSTLGDGLHGTPEYSAGTDCHFINGNNLIDGRIVIKPHTKTVSMAEMQKHKKPMTQQTVLVSINGTLGSVAFYNDENVVLGKSACYFNLSSFVDKHFIKRLIESPYFVDYAVENSTGTTIRNLGLMAMNNFPIPLPPLAEQRRIVAKANQLMAMVDDLEAQLAASRATAKNLLDALVAELTSHSTS